MPAVKSVYVKENTRPAGNDDVGLVGRMGAYEESRRKLREERKREYNQYLAKVYKQRCSVCCVDGCMYIAECTGSCKCSSVAN